MIWKGSHTHIRLSAHHAKKHLVFSFGGRDIGRIIFEDDHIIYPRSMSSIFRNFDEMQ